MTSNQSATKKAKFRTPKRCLLVQAALWFVDGVKPIPDEAFLLVPKHFLSEQPDFSELFRALKVGRCDLRGDLVLDFQPDSHSIVLVQNHEYPRFQHQGYEFKLEGSDLEDVDFAGSSIKYQSDLIQEEVTKKSLEDFKRANAENHKWRERTCFIQNVTVEFSGLRKLFSSQAIGKPQSTVSEETRCRKWLIGLMTDGPKKNNKPGYLRDAQSQFDISERGFNQAWARAVEESGSDWSKQGRRKS